MMGVITLEDLFSMALYSGDSYELIIQEKNKLGAAQLKTWTEQNKPIHAWAL